MTQTIDRAQIEHVAVLASLTLSEEEATKMTEEIGAILAHVSELSALDTTDVPPTAHVQLEAAAWRPDVVLPGVTTEEALSQAPRSAQGGFAVPAFLEG